MIAFLPWLGIISPFTMTPSSLFKKSNLSPKEVAHGKLFLPKVSYAPKLTQSSMCCRNIAFISSWHASLIFCRVAPGIAGDGQAKSSPMCRWARDEQLRVIYTHHTSLVQNLLPSQHERFQSHTYICIHTFILFYIYVYTYSFEYFVICTLTLHI